MNQNLSNFFPLRICRMVFSNTLNGLHSLLAGQRTMNGKTSLLMFPIHGCAAVIAPLYARNLHVSLFLPGLLYMFGFYLVEFVSGSILKEFEMCPWDYSGAAFQYWESSVLIMLRCGLQPD